VRLRAFVFDLRLAALAQAQGLCVLNRAHGSRPVQVAPTLGKIKINEKLFHNFSFIFIFSLCGLSANDREDENA
jgi:hypothetical protein